MKNILLTGFLLLLTFVACQDNQKKSAVELPRVAMAGIAIESSTFSPARSHEDAFHADVGEEVFGKYPFLTADSLDRKRAVWFPTLQGHALPGGMVTREAYDSLLEKTLGMLKTNLPFRFFLGGMLAQAFLSSASVRMASVS